MVKSEDVLRVSNNENIDTEDQHSQNVKNGEQKTGNVYVEMQSSSLLDESTEQQLSNKSKDEEDDNHLEPNDITLTTDSIIDSCNSTQQPSSSASVNDSSNSNTTITHKRSVQLEYIQRIVLRALWKHPQSWPFREPVDPIKDNAQDYFTVIKNPMDLGTIRSKLLNGRYENSDECIRDFRLIFENCYTYNSEGLVIRGMCECLEAFFNEKINNMPPVAANDDKGKDVSHSESTVGPKKRHKESGGVKTPSKKKKLQPTSNNSSVNKSAHKSDVSVSKTPEKKVANTSEHTASRRDSRKSTTNVNGSRSHTPSQNRHLSFNFFAHTSNIPAASTSASLKYCLSMVRELFTKKHSDYAWPFYDPVDTQSLQLLDYNNIIHYPMDLNSICKNLETGKYLTAFECITDLRRMVTNSCRYNHPDHIVSQAGQRLIVAIELLIAKAPPEVYDFLVVAPCSIIIPKIDALPEAVAGVVSMCKQTRVASDTTQAKRSSSSTRIIKTKKEQSYISDEDYDDDCVNPITSREQHGAGFVSVEMNHAEPMTYEEKRKLSLEINRMPTEKLGDIIAFLSELESDIFKEKNQSEVEIDFDNMKPETLRALEKYVKHLNKPQKPRKKKPSTSSTSTHNNAKNSSSNNFNSKLQPQITNISNPLTSTLKKPSGFSENFKKSNHVSSSNSKFHVVSSLPLSEESDCSDGEDQKLVNQNTKKQSSCTASSNCNNNNNNLSSVSKVHSNISISRNPSKNLTSVYTSNKSASNSGSNTTTSKNVANKLSFDTVDVSLLPSEMLNTCKKTEFSSTTDLLNEAKATVKQQKLASLNSTNTPTTNTNTKNDNDNVKNQHVTPLGLSNSSGESPLNISGKHSNKHTLSVLTSSNSSGSGVSAIKPEIRGDTNAPKAPTSQEERERMKQEERLRRLAVASTTHSNKIGGDMITSFDEKL